MSQNDESSPCEFCNGQIKLPDGSLMTCNNCDIIEKPKKPYKSKYNDWDSLHKVADAYGHTPYSENGELSNSGSSTKC